MPLRDQFTSPTILDGSWGTLLQTMGLPAGTCPDAWNIERPDQVEAIGRAYVEAGSQIIITNTFRANRLTLARHGLADRVRDVNRAGARASLAAARGRAKVFASVGPSGKLLASGDTNPAELSALFEEQIRALAEEAIDGLVLETFSDLDEIRIALATAKATGLPVVACMVFDSGPQRDRTMMGIKPEQAADALTRAGADAVGSNCGWGVASFPQLTRRLRQATDLPLWLKPNAGLPSLSDGLPVYEMAPAEFATAAREMVAAGADFVGGCCGTSPDFIRAVAGALQLARPR